MNRSHKHTHYTYTEHRNRESSSRSGARGCKQRRAWCVYIYVYSTIFPLTGARECCGHFLPVIAFARKFGEISGTCACVCICIYFTFDFEPRETGSPREKWKRVRAYTYSMYTCVCVDVGKYNGLLFLRWRKFRRRAYIAYRSIEIFRAAFFLSIRERRVCVCGFYSIIYTRTRDGDEDCEKRVFLFCGGVMMIVFRNGDVRVCIYFIRLLN